MGILVAQMFFSLRESPNSVVEVMLKVKKLLSVLSLPFVYIFLV